VTPSTIFVCDDDPTYVEMIAEVLTDAGYPRVIWHVGAAAFQRIRDAQPTLILLDINLGNPARGWSTLDALCLHPKTRHIPVIICSTDMRMVREKEAMLRELNCQILEKPFEFETLMDRVVAAIGPPPT